MDTNLCRHIPMFDNFLMKTFVLNDLRPVTSLSACAVRCTDNLECGSFFYIEVRGERLCQTHSILFSSAERADVNPGARYYQLTQGWCPFADGYMLNRKLSLCYRYVDKKQTWESAQTFCSQEGGHLLWLTSQEEADHVKHFLLSSSSDRRGQHVSVGIHMTDGQVWTLTDGRRVSFTDWAEGEPNSGRENCVLLAWFYSFQWNDSFCTGYQWPALCQLDRTGHT
ncbi:C-type lectin [Plakobranchus ocellatus]|uniref:C-type lectin n=1 Tax=Plakobranchus ocellatus TaxID=259542 RepID=A0AAV4CW44_9GAST|nr:C-type lectin [Plakobranchus ocellatus]